MTRSLHNLHREPAAVEEAIEVERTQRDKVRRATCATCRDWSDIIDAEGPDGPTFSPHTPWDEHDGQCPTCGRKPRRIVVRVAFMVPPPRPVGAF